uniref:Uncharacterized protein n=3 Tax=Amphimedon queenslandica TaxID=400682 RepID=A0A1X7SW28_AMPQE
HAFSLTLCYFNGGRAEPTVHFCGTIVLVWKLNTDRSANGRIKLRFLFKRIMNIGDMMLQRHL